MRNPLQVFISSSMAELSEERALVRALLEKQPHIRAWVFEQDAGGRTESIRSVYLESVAASDLYLGIFHRRYGEHTIEEYRHAVALGKDRLIFLRQSRDDGTDPERDPELQAFLDEVGDVERGVTIAWYADAADFGEKAERSITEWVVERARARRRKVRTLPPLIADRCDRRRVKGSIQRAAFEQNEADVRRHVVSVIRGHEDERHRQLLEVLADREIPEAMEGRDRTVLRWERVDWPAEVGYEQFRDELVRSLAKEWLEDGKVTFDPGPIVQAMDAHDGPILVTAIARLAELVPNPLPYLENYLRFWNEWPLLPRGQVLYALFDVSYGTPKRGLLGRPRRLKPSVAELEEAVASVSARAEGGAWERLHVVGTPVLEPVPGAEAERWVDLDDVRDLVGDRYQAVVDRVRECYDDEGLLVDDTGVRMGQLAPSLERILTEVVSEGA